MRKKNFLNKKKLKKYKLAIDDLFRYNFIIWVTDVYIEGNLINWICSKIKKFPLSNSLSFSFLLYSSNLKKKKIVEIDEEKN